MFSLPPPTGFIKEGTSLKSWNGSIYIDEHGNNAFVIRDYKKKKIDKRYIKAIKYSLLYFKKHPNVLKCEKCEIINENLIFRIEDKLDTTLQQIFDSNLIDSLPQKTAIEYAKQLLQIHLVFAAGNLLSRSFIPSNFFVFQDVIKIAPFAKPIIKHISDTESTTPIYDAPERLQFKSYDDSNDLWSIGIIIYIMIYKEHPFLRTQDRLQNYHRLKNEDFCRQYILPDLSQGIVFPKAVQVDESIKDLIRLLLSEDPMKRKTWRICIEINENIHHRLPESMVDFKYASIVEILKNFKILSKFLHKSSIHITKMDENEESEGIRKSKLNDYFLQLVAYMLNQKTILVFENVAKDKTIQKEFLYDYYKERFQKDNALEKINRYKKKAETAIKNNNSVNFSAFEEEKTCLIISKVWKMFDDVYKNAFNKNYLLNSVFRSLIVVFGELFVKKIKEGDFQENKAYYLMFINSLEWEYKIKDQVKNLELQNPQKELKFTLKSENEKFAREVVLNGNPKVSEQHYLNYCKMLKQYDFSDLLEIKKEEETTAFNKIDELIQSLLSNEQLDNDKSISG